MVRNRDFVLTQLRLRKAEERQRLAAIGEPTMEGNPFDYFGRQRALVVIADLEHELDALWWPWAGPHRRDAKAKP